MGILYFSADKKFSILMRKLWTLKYALKPQGCLFRRLFKRQILRGEKLGTCDLLALDSCVHPFQVRRRQTF